jgi:hypothetical protein
VAYSLLFKKEVYNLNWAYQESKKRGKSIVCLFLEVKRNKLQLKETGGRG